MPARAAAAAAGDEAPPPLTLEFELAPAAAARLTRHPTVAAARAGRRARAASEALIWLDTPDGALAAEGWALEAPHRGARRCRRVLGGPGRAAWLPGTPPPAAADGDRPVAADTDPEGLVPLAAFEGRRTLLTLGTTEGPVTVELLAGKLRAVAAERPAARLALSGAPGAVLGLARALATDGVPLLPPRAALAEEGRALARGEAPRPRRPGPPDLGGARTVEAALLAGLGHLLEALLYHAPRCRPEAGPEGVHQARVALRRLRSVLRAFRPAVDCPAVAAFDAGLSALAGRLGAARDLDVFLGAGGLGPAAVEALGGGADRRLAALLRAAEARRGAAYAALRAALDDQSFRLLVLDGLAVALERPWRAAAAEAPEQAATLEEPLTAFGARLLDKRWRRLRRGGEEIGALGAEALHALRLDAKRLRYAAEIFAPLWPGKAARRFGKRLAAVQEALGTANDAAVARTLVAGLGAGVPGWAVGAVEGFAAARVAPARRGALDAWEGLMLAEPFWQHA